MWISSKNRVRIKELELDLKIISSKLDELEQKFRQLRGLVNRKIGYSEADTNTEKNISPDGLDSLRGII